MRDLAADRAQREPVEAAAAARPEDQQVAVLRGADKLLGGEAMIERTCTDAGLAGAASFSAFSVASSTAWRSFSWSPLSAGTVTGLPVTQLAMTG